MEAKLDNAEKLKKLEASVLSIEKDFGKGAIMRLGSRAIQKIDVCPTGIMTFDNATGIGGFPRGRITEIWGENQSGKTTLVSQAMAEAQSTGGLVAIIDTEHCIAEGSFVYEKKTDSYFSIEEKEGEEVSLLAFDSYGNQREQPGIIKCTGEKPVTYIKTKYGYEQELTGNHKVLTKKGDKLVSELVVGDILLTPIEISSPSITNSLSEREIQLYKFLGYHISNGSISKTNISTIDPDVIKDLSIIAKEFGLVVTDGGNALIRLVQSSVRRYRFNEQLVRELIYDNGYNLGELSCYFGVDISTIKKFLKDINFNDKIILKKNRDDVRVRKLRVQRTEIHTQLYGVPNDLYSAMLQFPSFSVYSVEREIPKNLFKEALRYVLACMIVSDGTIVDYDCKHRFSGSYSTNSRKLAYDFSKGMRRFGIKTNMSVGINPKTDGTFYATTYIITFTGLDAFNILATFPIVGYKMERIKKAIRKGKMNFSRSKTFNKFIECPILKIVPDYKIKKVFDISLKTTNESEQYFLCNNLVIHNCFDVAYAKNLGINTDDLWIAQPDYGEQALSIAETLIDSGQFDLIFIDSVAVLTPKAEIEGDIGDSHMGLMARMIGQAMRKLTAKLAKSNTALVLSNQTRMKIGVMFGSPITTTGGTAIKFFASMRVELTKTETTTSGTEATGTKVRAKIVKNKLAPPFKEAEMENEFGRGFSREASVLSEGVRLGVINKSGSWYNYGETKLGQGAENAKNLMRSTPAIYEKIQNDVRIAFQKVQAGLTEKNARPVRVLESVNVTPVTVVKEGSKEVKKPKVFLKDAIDLVKEVDDDGELAL